MSGPEFREALRGLRLSQRAFALRAGLNVNTVNAWATEVRPVPRYAVYIVELLQERQRVRDSLA